MISRTLPAVFAMLFLSSLFAQNNPVQQFQPNIRYAGRAISIAVNPSNQNEVTVASETGGMFQSTDAGYTWRHINFPNYLVTDLKYWPGNPNTILAVCSKDSRVNNNAGIWVSNNKGTTWTHEIITSACSGEMQAWCIAFESGTNKILIGTDCGVASSTNGGTSWSLNAVGPGNQNIVRCIVSTGTGRLCALTDGGIFTSDDAAVSWSATSALPVSAIYGGVHNSIGKSPLNSNDLFWGSAYTYVEPPAEKRINLDGTPSGVNVVVMLMSTDGGKSWTNIYQIPRWGRWPVIGTSLSSSNANAIDVFLGYGTLVKNEFQYNGNSISMPVSGWTNQNIDHSDVNDISFMNDNKTPYLLATDGGLHRLSENNINWTSIGNRTGYEALQITEVTGQLHQNDTGYDLYFGTQDNNIYGSPDNGISWPSVLGAEGFNLQIARTPMFYDFRNKINGTSCASCQHFLTDPLFKNWQLFNNVKNAVFCPGLVSSFGTYMQSSKGINNDSIYVSIDRGANWQYKLSIPEQLVGMPQITGDIFNPVIYVAVSKTRNLTSGSIGIKRINNLLGNNPPIVSDVIGFGSLSYFPTMFMWYKPFGVDPFNSNHLIVVDNADSTIKFTLNGGATWTEDNTLTSMVTENGNLKMIYQFSGPSRFSQVQCYGFDPDLQGHILIGTNQAGIFETFNGGSSWQKISGSEALMNLSSFFFPGDGSVMIGTYGSGLWKLPKRNIQPDMSTTNLFMSTHEEKLPPMIYLSDGTEFPLDAMNHLNSHEKIYYLLAKGQGTISDITTDSSLVIQNVVTENCELVAFDDELQQAELSLPQNKMQDEHNTHQDHNISYQNKTSSGNAPVKGLIVSEGKLLGIISGEMELHLNELPQTHPHHANATLSVPVENYVAGTPTFELFQPVQIKGTHFTPDPGREQPFEIKIDGITYHGPEKIYAGHDGTFNILLQPFATTGPHEISVMQPGMEKRYAEIIINVIVMEVEGGAESNK